MLTTVAGNQPDSGEYAFIDQVIARRSGRPGALLGILEEIQEHNPRKYLCLDILRYIAAKTNTPLSRVFSVVTFYALFNREPQGEHTVAICRGTACHVSRSPRNTIESSATNTGPAEMRSAAAPELTVCSPKFSDTW